MGYRLADAGPHPNRAHAAWGRRGRRLEPDPESAPVVRWIFAQRLAGHGIARITRALNDAGIPCPSAADPGRNTHRSGQAWTLTTVRAILAKPPLHRPPGMGPAAHGHGPDRPGQHQPRASAGAAVGLPEGWVISARPAHPALVSEEDFIAVQGIRAARENTETERRYRLAGLLHCGICRRRLESCWANNRAASRHNAGTPTRTPAARHTTGSPGAGTPDHGRPPRTHRPQAGTAIRWPRATLPRIPSRGRRNTGVPDPEDVPPAVATTGTTSTCCPGPTARCVRRRAAREAPFRNKRRSTNVGDAEVDA